jgi:sulfatase maturation enzyme AslB (radical SAM superfamily)
MDKIKFSHLDIPIIRSCNLACKGCLTHSDHKNIKGIVKVTDSLEWLKFWAQKLRPETITLFGGEPLLHPDFADWAETVKAIFAQEPYPGTGQVLAVNTNGYYIDRLYDHIPRLFDVSAGYGGNYKKVALNMIISIQTGIEPYLSKVQENVETLKQKIVDYHLSLAHVRTAEWNLWLDEYEVNTKRWYRLIVNGDETPLSIATCEQYKIAWCTHYKGVAEQMEPVYDYTDTWFRGNHERCQAKNFVTLYRGAIWKCPTMGVLEHTLDTFGIADRPDWAPFLKDYTHIDTTSSDSDIAAWFEQQKQPEQVCNMCGFTGPSDYMISPDERSHHLKNHWKYSL